MTSIIQWNINGFFKRSVDINRVLYELNPRILCFQETNLKNSQLPNFKTSQDILKIVQRQIELFIHKNIESKDVTI